MKSQLLIPPAAARDSDSVEMARVWIAEVGLHCALNIGIYEEREGVAWGVILADIARHVSDAIEQSGGMPAHAALATIQESFERELDSPTSAADGEFSGRA